jgi:hypothetical protein
MLKPTTITKHGARINPHAIHERGYQVRISFSFLAYVVGNIVVGPYLLSDRLITQRYRDFLQTFESGLLEDVPLVWVRDVVSVRWTSSALCSG